MNEDLKYYVINRANDDNIPLLVEDDDCPAYLYQKKKIENPGLMEFKFGDPIPRKPIIADYHSSPQSIISKKIYDVLEPMKIDGVQLLPARIIGRRKDFYENFWAIHVFNIIKCIDPKLSDCQIDEDGISYVNKIVLDGSSLMKIPLKQRLIFRLKEDWGYVLFHSSIVDAILKVNPTGVKFTDITKWNDESYFED